MQELYDRQGQFARFTTASAQMHAKGEGGEAFNCHGMLQPVANETNWRILSLWLVSILSFSSTSKTVVLAEWI